MAELNLRLRQAIAAARAGKVPQAILLAENALEEEPEDVNALLLLSALAETKEEQIVYLDRIVAIDPDHAIARKRLSQLRDVPATVSDAPVDTLEDSGVGAAPDTPTPSEPAGVVVAPQFEEAATQEADEPEAEALTDVALSEPAVAEDEPLPTQEAAEPQFEEVGELSTTDESTEPSFEEPPSSLNEFVEPSPVESLPFEGEVLPGVFARKVEALLPDEMAQSFDDAPKSRSVVETKEPLENDEPLAFEEMARPALAAAEAFAAIEEFPEDEPEETLFEESSESTEEGSFGSSSEDKPEAFFEETAAEQNSEPYFEDANPFPAMEEADFPIDDPMATLLTASPEPPDEATPEQLLSELHDFPVEELRKPAAPAEDESQAGIDSETSDLAAAQLFEPSPGEMEDLAAEEADPPEEQLVDRPFLAVTAPLSHDVVESPPEAREGLAAQLDEELFEEEAGPDLENPINRDSPETGQILAAASLAALESEQGDEFDNDDAFASLVDEVAGPVTEDAGPITGFEPAAESDIPEWLREAEDASLEADDVRDQAETTLGEPAELNDIPAWLLDDADDEWLTSESETTVAPTTSSGASIDAEAAPNAATEAVVAAPVAVASYSDDEIDAAMATIVDEDVDFSSSAVDSSKEELAEMPSEEPVDAIEGEKPAGKVSTRALEVFLIALVVVAVVVLAALALVVFNPFS